MPPLSSIGLVFISIFLSFSVITISTYKYLSNAPPDTKTFPMKRIMATRLKRDLPNKDPWDQMITLNKCCGQNEIFNQNKNECEAREYDLFNPSGIIEKMEFFVVDENLKTANINASRITFNYGYLNSTVRPDAIVVANWLLNDVTVKTNYLFSQKDGTLLELDKSQSSAVKNFSTAAYCIDENNSYGNGLIAYIYPCIENFCLWKCCPKDWYYNTVEEKCVINSPIEYKPEFYFVTSISEKHFAHYLLHGKPICKQSEFVSKLNSNTSHPIYIQEDGYLLVVDYKKNNYSFYGNKSYCVDVFSDGLRETYISGLYCEKDFDFMRPGDIDINVIKSVNNETTLAPHKSQRNLKLEEKINEKNNTTPHDTYRISQKDSDSINNDPIRNGEVAFTGNIILNFILICVITRY